MIDELPGFKVPDWVKEDADKWVRILGLNEWAITLTVHIAPDGDADNAGFTRLEPDYNRARVIFRCDISDTPYWHGVVFHEMLHIACGRMTHLVEVGIFPELPTGVQSLAYRIFHQAMEALVTTLATGIGIELGLYSDKTEMED